MRQLKIQAACAKCLVTGEHTILHGAPALCAPLPLYVTTKIEPSSTKLWSINFDSPLTDNLEIDTQKLKDLYEGVEARYTQYLENTLEINQVLRKDTDLAACTLYLLANECQLTHPISLAVHSQIPVGRGLGSSGALIVAILKHSANNQEKLLKLCSKIENFQHGVSSGLDPHTSLTRSMIIKKGHKIYEAQLPKRFWQTFTLVDTGAPQSSTGQCVEHTQKILSKNKKLLDKITQTSHKIIDKILSGQFSQINSYLHQNHLLLKELEIVPDRVCEFIEDLYHAGIGAKVCGAGSVHGSQAGFVLVASSVDKIGSIIDKYDYKALVMDSFLPTMQSAIKNI